MRAFQQDLLDIDEHLSTSTAGCDSEAAGAFIIWSQYAKSIDGSLSEAGVSWMNSHERYQGAEGAFDDARKTMACHVLDSTMWMTKSPTLANSLTAMCENLDGSRTGSGMFTLLVGGLVNEPPLARSLRGRASGSRCLILWVRLRSHRW